MLSREVVPTLLFMLLLIVAALLLLCIRACHRLVQLTTNIDFIFHSRVGFLYRLRDLEMHRLVFEHFLEAFFALRQKLVDVPSHRALVSGHLGVYIDAAC